MLKFKRKFRCLKVKKKKGYLKTKEEALDQTVENSLWKRHIWTCRKTDNEMNECRILDSTALCDRNKRQQQLFSATEITSSPHSRGETC